MRILALRISIVVWTRMAMVWMTRVMCCRGRVIILQRSQSIRVPITRVVIRRMSSVCVRM